MSEYNGREHLPPFPPAPFTQPTFLTLEEVESRQFAQGNNAQLRQSHSQPNYSKKQHKPHKTPTMPMIDISHSNLQPTAQEFQPAFSQQYEASSGFESAQSQQHMGAVRRNNHPKNSQNQPQQQQVRANKNRDKDFREKNHLKTDVDNEREQSTGHNRDRRKTQKDYEMPRNAGNMGQNRYNHNNYNQNQDTGSAVTSGNFSNPGNSNNGNGNKYKNRNSYQGGAAVSRDLRDENYKTRDKDKDNYRDYRDREYNSREAREDYSSSRNSTSREKDNARDFRDRGDEREALRRDFRDRKNYRDRDNRDNRDSFKDYNNRDNGREIRDRDNSYKDNWKSKGFNNSYNDRSSHKNWRERSNNSNTSTTTTKTDDHFDKYDKSDRRRKNDEKPDGNHVSVVQKDSKDDYYSSNNKFNRDDTSYKKKLDAASQRERLEHMVTHRMIECLVCCEKVRHTDRVWSCKQCFHILHLSCVQKWAKSSKLENGWRCPACQNVLDSIPNEYRCYCDKYSDPKFEPGLLAHSCGEVCRRTGRNCGHTCTLLCHPGPCPDCVTMVQRFCGCGATKVTVKCNSNLPLTCDGVCNKLLNCELHACGEKCHWDDCKLCLEKVRQECFCGKQGRKVVCDLEAKGVEHYECGDVCGKVLSCGNHKCTKKCHSGDCSLCPTDPIRVKDCPCGKKKLTVVRKSCLDDIPCCDKVCAKVLNCGQPSKPHRCEETCHTGECPQCPATTMVRCRCGHMYKEIACKDLTTKADDARCQKKCTKMRMCSKHKCNKYCCIEIEHRCPLLCNRNLSCGLHKCESNCHSGRCEVCWQTSFEELYCECGSSVIYPPVPCGTRAPACNKQCSRPRPCGHEPHHNCHTGPCPACTLFTTKLCHGGHESRGTIPCHQEDFSCGMPCNKEMPCGQHRCIQICHKGPCPTPCTQPCIMPKNNCEHLCNRPCHQGPCPNKACKQTVVTTCQCGLKQGSNICMNMISEYQKIAMVQLAAKMADMNRGQSVDITDIDKMRKKGGAHKILECTDECKLIERNRRMAIGLQIRNPDLSAKLTPRYTDFLKQWAKKDPRFCQSVHDKLTELVQLAKQSKQKSRSHSFECMNRDKRHFVHELCEHFGVDSAAYDAEPNRNVVATASKEKSWLPSCSLIELLQRENGQRKVPGPVLKPQMRNLNAHSSSLNPIQNESVSLRSVSSRNTGASTMLRPTTPPGEYIDYFDNPPL